MSGSVPIAAFGARSKKVPPDDSPDCSRLFVLPPLGMKNWSIRKAEPRDATALTDCIDAAYSVYAPHIKDLPAVSEGVSEEIENHLVWVAELDQLIVGGLVLILKDGFALLANIAVDPACSGMGLGRDLIELAEAECRKLGMRELRLSTHVAMPENVGIYAHLEWTEIGRSGNKVHMTKHL